MRGGEGGESTTAALKGEERRKRSELRMLCCVQLVGMKNTEQRRADMYQKAVRSKWWEFNKSQRILNLKLSTELKSKLERPCTPLLHTMLISKREATVFADKANIFMSNLKCLVVFGNRSAEFLDCLFQMNLVIERWNLWRWHFVTCVHFDEPLFWQIFLENRWATYNSRALRYHL